MPRTQRSDRDVRKVCTPQTGRLAAYPSCLLSPEFWPLTPLPRLRKQRAHFVAGSIVKQALPLLCSEGQGTCRRAGRGPFARRAVPLTLGPRNGLDSSELS